ncbi:hypothetical protein Dimus_004526 [Dionaea muscipula]
MQGHRTTIGSLTLPDSLDFDCGSTSSNVGVDHQICWGNLCDHPESRLTDYTISASSSDTYMATLAQEGQNLNRWFVGEPSSSTPPNLVNHDEQLMQNGWSSSMSAATSSLAPRVEAQCYQPSGSVPRNITNLTLDGNHQNVNGTSFMQFHGSGASSHNYDLNIGPLGEVGDDHMECINSSKIGGVENKLMMPSGSNPSDPFSSAASGVEEDDSRPGCSLDGRRLSCKRKAFEGNAGQSSSGGSCFLRESSCSIWPDVSPCYNNNNNAGSSMNVSTPFESSHGVSPPDSVNPRLGLGVGGYARESHAPNVAGGAEGFHRNYRVRVNSSNQQNSIPSHSYFSAANGHSSVPSAHQPLRFLPINPSLDLMSSTPPDNAAAAVPSQSFATRMPSLRRHMQALRWNASSSSTPASSSSAVAGSSCDTDAPLNDDLASRTMTRNISTFTSATEDTSSTPHPTHWDLSGANATFPRNVASSSRSGQSSGSHSSAGPNGVPHRHSQSQYSRRLSGYVPRSLLSSVGSEVVAPGHNILAQRTASASSHGLPPSGSGSEGHNHSYPQSALWIERQGEGVVGAPYSLRALATAGEGRSRLVSEIRNVLDIMRRGEGLRFEDIMILDQTVLFGMSDMHDQHRDMRLDVDNMSYEELLALEERIGNVCTGLSEETVLSRMKRRRYLSSMREEQTDMEPCCICQENYNDGEELGTLDCGHDFHTDCIKQWLARKSLCPICKTTALST